jgi:CheY-like chemotaxis protein
MKGTTFHVYFPWIQDQMKPESPSFESIPTGNERILLVDDETPQLRSAAHMLERLGYRVVAKTDSLEALAAFHAQCDAFDLVITDQSMPKMTGNRLAQSILRLRPDFPVILCTGYSETIDEAEAKTMGIRGFVMKPYTVKEMAEKIRNVLKKGNYSPTPTEFE